MRHGGGGTGFNWLIALLCLLALGPCPRIFAAEREMKVAVLAYRGGERAMARWSATMDYLSEQVPGYRFRAVPLDLPAIDRAVMEHEVDFAITNSGQYVRIGSKHGLSWLATLQSRRHPGREQVIGSVLVVRSDSPYLQLDDLRNAELGAVSPLAFGGYQIFAGEMSAKGYRPERFFDDIRFSGFPVDALIYWVRDGVVDGAVVPACLLEKMSEEGMIALTDYRVLEGKAIENFACTTSTDLFPNWSFSKLKATAPEVAEQVARALLAMPAESEPARQSGSFGWTAPVSSYDIHQLYTRLAIHPWQEPWWVAMRGWLKQNWPWGLGILMLIVAGFLHHLWVQLMVQRRTRELQQMNEELLHQQQQLEHAQRVAILGELSSDLAHELNQPLAAINSYAEGGLVRTAKAAASPDLSGILRRISSEAQRGAKIIERIRCFARKEGVQRTSTDLGGLVRETLSLLEYELKKHPLELIADLPNQGPTANVDPVEIQQLLVNLVRNSLEAMVGQDGPQRLMIRLQPIEAGLITLQVSDTGKGVEDAEVELLFKPFYSTKAQGLGLGMAICKRIVESHGGSIQIKSGEAGGSVVRCTLTESGCG